MPISLEKKYQEILFSILKKYPYTFYAFGSRTKGKAKKFSDLDLCYVENISIEEISELVDELENSDLPIKIDLINFNKISKEFKNLIKNDLLLVQLGKNKMVL